MSAPEPNNTPVTPTAAPAAPPATPAATAPTVPVAPSPTPTAAPDQATAQPAAPDPEAEKAQVAENTKRLASAKSNYKQAQIKKVFGKLRRHVAFFIVCGLFAFSTLWIFATAWQQEKAGENENWFHEVLFLVIMVALLVTFYFRLYQKSEVFQAGLAKREAAEKAANDAKLQLEEEQKRQAFTGLIKDFQAATTYEQKSSTMAKLLTVGLESSLLRQQAIDLLCDLNQWMVEHRAFLSNQNLIIWRLKSSLFENSERFPVDGSTQDLSIKAINIIEAIVKRHLADFAEGRTKDALNLTGKAIPTLTLTAQNIPAGSLLLEKSILWQSSFSETQLVDLSFAEADLQSSSFWRAEMANIEFNGTTLGGVKLRTNLEAVKNIDPAQFFASKEWELCYLNPDQITAMFADPAKVPAGAKDQWDSAEPRRRKIYFQLTKNQNTL